MEEWRRSLCEMETGGKGIRKRKSGDLGNGRRKEKERRKGEIELEKGRS